MIGVIDVGGGLRDIYGAGIFDYCLKEGVTFDYAIGVSAGSANLASFLAGQKGRNYRFYTEYAFRKEYMSVGNFFHTGSYVNLDYVYGGMSNSQGENPLDYETLKQSPTILKVVAANARTGETHFFDKQDLDQDHYDIFKASSAIPVVNKPYVIDGEPYFDGGIGDPIPFQKAFADGCSKVVVILTRPRSYLRSSKKDEYFAKLLRHKYPVAATNLSLRAMRYNEELKQCWEYEEQGNMLILAPDSIAGMETLTKDLTAINVMYQKGRQDAVRLKEFIGRDSIS